MGASMVPFCWFGGERGRGKSRTNSPGLTRSFYPGSGRVVRKTLLLHAFSYSFCITVDMSLFTTFRLVKKPKVLTTKPGASFFSRRGHHSSSVG